MPIYDVKCTGCGREFKDRLLKIDEVMPCPVCLASTEHMWSGGAVIGDEIDVEIKHGLCNPDGTPRRFRSREELKRAEKKAGLTNYVQHVDGDKHVKRWV